MAGPENKELVKVILGRIGHRGKIPFVEFMDLVLYHPQHGYYHSPRQKIGPEGDYYTSPNVHPIFGHLIARQLRQMWELLDRPSPFIATEMGAGKGLLCSDILEYCQSHLPDFFKNLLYRLAEQSPSFIKEQKNLLAKFLTAGKVAWIPPHVLLRGEKPFTGCLLSNELVDSFPVHIVYQGREDLQEIFVTHDGKTFQETMGSPSTPLLQEYFRSYACPLEEGQRAEANLKALEWMEGVSQALQRGFIMTIDYGYEAEELYHPARRQGTLLCYFRHTTSTNPYERLGYQDITTHVNFSALRRRGEIFGLRPLGCTEQYKFLAALGLLEDLEKGEKSSLHPSSPEFLRNKLAMKSFLVPGGMGTLFKVFVQSKGLEEVNLLGFRDPFMRPDNNP
ncbi:MAG: SAM-dependent methyltransferase [Deltaproteobacteria bacterium]|nr:SAM-dependent methyltransferase [Deltaproteobacteria bacterium]